MWFDENFLAVLLQRLGDVRSMFGFGSGRGDFERWFYEQVELNVLNDLSGRVLFSGPSVSSDMHPDSRIGSHSWCAMQISAVARLLCSSIWWVTCIKPGTYPC